MGVSILKSNFIPKWSVGPQSRGLPATSLRPIIGSGLSVAQTGKYSSCYWRKQLSKKLQMWLVCIGRNRETHGRDLRGMGLGLGEMRHTGG